MSRRTRILVLTALALMAGLVVAAFVNAPLTPEQRAQASTSAAVSSFASAADIPVDVAAWQRDFNMLCTKLRTDHPGDFSHAFIDAPSHGGEVPGASGEIWFAASMPAEVADQIKALDRVRVVEGTGFTEAEVHRDILRVGDLAAAIVGEAGGTLVGPNIAERTIEVRFDLTNAPTPSDADLAAMAERVRAAMPTADDLSSGFSVRVTASREPVYVPQVGQAQ